MKTLLFVRTEKTSLFDGSTNGNPVKVVGQVSTTINENMLKIKNGYVESDPFPDLETIDSFTIEASVQPEKLTGSRQNIVEAQSPPVALFIDDGGFVNGSVNISGLGWKSVKSKESLKAGQIREVVFSRNSKGKMVLEIDGHLAGQKTFPGTLSSPGDKGFRIGAGLNGSTYQYKGTIGNITIRSGVLTASAAQERIAQAKKIQAIIQAKLGPNAAVIVSPVLDESHARLQPIKDVMNAVGVEKISDLSTLKITTPTNIIKGKVLVAPKKTTIGSVNWGSLAGAFGSLSANKKKDFLAKYLTNRNSIETLKKPTSGEAPNNTVTPGLVSGGLTGRADTLGSNIPTGLRFPREVIAVNPILEGLRVANTISAHINLDKTKPTVLDRDVLIRNLESRMPEDLPQLSSTPRMLSMQVLPVNSSVIIAGTLDLTDTQLIVEPDVEKLYIIAEKLVCGPNAKITWRKPGGSTPPRLDNPDLNGRGYSGVHTKPNSRDGLDGGNGRAGDTGIDGANGRHAPGIEIWVKELTNIPGIDLNGEDGIKAGKGQKGGKGGNGADGQVGRKTCFIKCWCSTDPGDGGNGGHGGRGGDGGRGGSGGKGGEILIGVLDGTLAQTATAGQFHWKNQGGQKGNGGDTGQGGQGGYGGRSGVGKYCKNAKDGHKGSQAQPGGLGSGGYGTGTDGVNQFFEFSEDAWEDMMTRPWITEISPNEVFPGNVIKIKGSRFSSNDRVVILDVASLVPTINPDESLTVTIPGNIPGGTKSVFVRRAFDNTESNRIPIRIKPQLDTLPAELNPNAEVKITGKAFVQNAAVIINGNAIPGTVNPAGTEISFTMIGTGGAGSSGGSVTVAVRNPDGLVSNTRTATMPHILEIPFTFGIHNLPFKNFADGVPSWGTYKDTFGSAEVWHESLDPIFGHPILTAAYYGFYHHFLKGEDNGGLATGFCTALSCLVADKLWQGLNDANTTTKAPVHKWFTAVHGKLLSRESLIHFHDQGQQGITRVELTARAIERTFMTGCDRYVAPLLFFIPSGAVWDSGYFDKLGDTHCIMPYRFIYPASHNGPQLSADGSTTVSSLDGVKLYCWDCNKPDSANCRLEFRMQGGKLHYSYYTDDDCKFDTADGITLGHWTNGAFLHADHDLPFSGPFGLTSFIIDFLLSPADLQITNENGLRVGNFNNMLFSEIPDSHPVYLAKGAYLLPVGQNLTRKIVGNDAGKYTFNTLMPDGTTIRIEEVSTQAGHVDTLIVSSDASQLRFTPHEHKEFTLTYSKMVDDQLRAFAISGVGAAPGKEMDVTVSPDLSFLRLGNRDINANLMVKAFSIEKTTNIPVNNNASSVLPTNHDLIVTISDWGAVDLNIETISF